MLLLACVLLTSGIDPHPAVKMDSATLLAAFEKGYKEADKKKDYKAIVESCRRGIGSVKTAPLRSETVSWLWFWHPKILAYGLGFRAKKQFWPDEEIASKKKTLEEIGPKLTQLHFSSIISIYPSFGAAYGRISRYADPSDLLGVRVVMQVGDRIYQPARQPGDLQAASGTNTSTVMIPQIATSSTRSTVTGSAYGSDGSSAYGSAYGKSQTTYYYNTYRQQNWSWYQGSFEAVFDINDPDGTPRIRKDDKEFTVIVIYGPNQRKATYKLADLEKLAK